MKKLVVTFCFVLFSIIAFGQFENIKPSVIENQIDSLVKKYNVRQIEVLSANNVSVPRSAIFKIENGFLIVSDEYYFNLNKLVSMQLVFKALPNGYYILFSFN